MGKGGHAFSNKWGLEIWNKFLLYSLKTKNWDTHAGKRSDLCDTGDILDEYGNSFGFNIYQLCQLAHTFTNVIFEQIYIYMHKERNAHIKTPGLSVEKMQEIRRVWVDEGEEALPVSPSIQDHKKSNLVPLSSLAQFSSATRLNISISLIKVSVKHIG